MACVSPRHFVKWQGFVQEVRVVRTIALGAANLSHELEPIRSGCVWVCRGRRGPNLLHRARQARSCPTERKFGILQRSRSSDDGVSAEWLGFISMERKHRHCLVVMLRQLLNLFFG
jgi:hypothetical protein